MQSHRYWYFYVSLCPFMLYDQCSMYFGIEILSPCTRIFLSPCFLWFILFMYSYYTYMSLPYYHFSLFSARLLITSEKGVCKKRIYRYAVYFSRELLLLVVFLQLRTSEPSSWTFLIFYINKAFWAPFTLLLS